MALILSLAAALGLYALALVAANRWRRPPAVEAAGVRGAPSGSAAAVPDAVTVTTWNIGYAGMGAESDFVMDNGRQLRPLSAGLVDGNLAGIAAEIARQDPDIALLQEVALPSWNTYRRDVLAALRRALPGHAWTFGADAATRLVPPPWSLRIGTAIFARWPFAAERRALPLEPRFHWGLFRKRYRMQVARLGGPQGWVIVNIHLSAFDSSADNTRERQVAEVLRFAQAEYALGAHVVIGGDWNLRLAANDFAHTTPAANRFWIRDFPQDRRPDGWHWAVDAAVPSVRTADKPYVRGENYRLTIDGFLVSPNVSVQDVAGTDLDFRHSDHNPVTARFRRKAAA